HPHELLDSVVKERFDQVFRLNRGRAFYSSLSYCQAVFRKSLFISTAYRFSEPVAAAARRRIIQAPEMVSTPFWKKDACSFADAYLAGASTGCGLLFFYYRK
ncbi:hypothetical protein, partial [Stutzerimonas azotifigens]|uniref:hypothetical protein n=1 Tax=Stutzerimonas azotifigens TaxID=291995 RepID=UPI001C6130BF